MAFTIGGFEGIPDVGRDHRRPFGVLMAGVCDDQRFGTGCVEVVRSEPGMVEIRRQPARRWEPEQRKQGCRHPTGHSETGVALSNVVEEGCPGGSAITRPIGEHGASRVEGVALVQQRLLPEQIEQPVVEQAGDLGSLPWLERMGAKGSEGPYDEVPDVGNGERMCGHGITSLRRLVTQSVRKSSEPSRKKSSANRMRKPNCSAR